MPTKQLKVSIWVKTSTTKLNSHQVRFLSLQISILRKPCDSCGCQVAEMAQLPPNSGCHCLIVKCHVTSQVIDGPLTIIWQRWLHKPDSVMIVMRLWLSWDSYTIISYHVTVKTSPDIESSCDCHVMTVIVPLAVMMSCPSNIISAHALYKEIGFGMC